MTPPRQVLARRQETSHLRPSGDRSSDAASDGTADRAGCAAHGFRNRRRRSLVVRAAPRHRHPARALRHLGQELANHPARDRRRRGIRSSCGGTCAARRRRRAQEHHRPRDDADERRAHRRRECLGHARAPCRSSRDWTPVVDRAPDSDLRDDRARRSAPDVLHVARRGVVRSACVSHRVAGGGEAPTFVRLFILCWPSYACAFVVVVPPRCSIASAVV